jgi:hypothetical protein
MMNQIKTRTFLSDDEHDNNSDRKGVFTATKKVCHWFYGRKNLEISIFCLKPKKHSPHLTPMITCDAMRIKK